MNSNSVNSLINKSASLKSKLLSQEHNLQDQVSSMSSTINSDEGGNMFSSLLFWLGIAILLIFLGFNVFTYLGDAGEFLRKLFAPILSFFGFTIGETAKQTIQTSATGSQGIIGGVAGAATSGINLLESNLTKSSGSNSSQSASSQSASSQSASSQSTTSPPLSTSPPSPASSIPKPSTSMQQENTPPSNPSGQIESIPVNNSKSGQVGYCFIGSEKGSRSCASITKSDTCMSGDIFPTLDLCVNPSLRE